MKQDVKNWFDRIGLLRPTFRIYQALKTMRLSAAPKQDRPGFGPDGLPLPPDKLIGLVNKHSDVSVFLEGGRRVSQRIQAVLQQQQLQLGDFKAVLDFGCGCGRVIRYWRSLTPGAQFYGTDYNGELVKWCIDNLPFAQFGVNAALPPLSYADQSFDFVYAFSVFTHLAEAAQSAWIEELSRVIRPQGYLLITVHGDGYLNILTPQEQAKFRGGELVVRFGSVAGTNMCAAFHPGAYLQQLIEDKFRLVQIERREGDQDFVLLQRRAT